MKVIHGYKAVAFFALALNIVVFMFNIDVYSFALFPYLESSLFNALFSLALIVVLALVSSKNYRFFPWFNVLIFIDTILVYGTMQNFLFHVAILVALTQLFYRLTVHQKRRKNISDHLLDNE